MILLVILKIAFRWLCVALGYMQNVLFRPHLEEGKEIMTIVTFVGC